MNSTNKFLSVIVAGVIFVGIGQAYRNNHNKDRVAVLDQECAKTGVVLVDRRNSTIAEVVDCRIADEKIWDILDEH